MRKLYESFFNQPAPSNSKEIIPHPKSIMQSEMPSQSPEDQRFFNNHPIAKSPPTMKVTDNKPESHCPYSFNAFVKSEGYIP